MQYVGSKNRLSKELAPIIQSYITIVLISEYSMPDDFKCIWEKELKTLLGSAVNKNSDKIRVEKLFVHKSQSKNGLNSGL